MFLQIRSNNLLELLVEGKSKVLKQHVTASGKIISCSNQALYFLRNSELFREHSRHLCTYGAKNCDRINVVRS